MYIFVDWMKCGCGNTNMLFKQYTRILKSGRKVIRVMKKCKWCYLEDLKIKNMVNYKKYRLSMLAQKKEHYYKNISKERKKALDYHYRNRDECNRKRRLRYAESKNKNKIISKVNKFVKDMKERVSLSNKNRCEYREDTNNIFLTEKL